MSKVVSRMKDLGQKAMALKAALDKAPETVEGLRQTLAATKDQVRQLRSEAQETVTELQDEAGLDLQESIRGLKASADLIRKAGFEITGVDVETGLAPRLRIHLRRANRMALSPKTSTAAGPLAQALLGTLEQAESWLLEPPLDSLEQDELIVTLGPVPSIRACWKAKATATEQASTLQTTFFAKRPPATPAPAPLPVVEAPAPEPEAPKPAAQKWTKESLERFKQMPTGTKYGR